MLRLSRRHRDIHRRTAEVAVPLDNLVREIEVVAENSRNHLANRRVILMSIGARGSDDEVGFARSRECFQHVLYLIPSCRESAIGEIMQIDSEVCSGQEGFCRLASLPVTFRRPGQHYVAGAQSRMAFGEGYQRCPCSNLNIIRVGADGEHRQPFTRSGLQTKWDHQDFGRESDDVGLEPSRAAKAETGPSIGFARPDRSGSQIIQGQLPRWYISSSCARSLTVSAGDQ